MARDEDESAGQLEDLLLLAVAGVGALIVGEGLRLALASIADRRRRGVRTLPAVAKLEGLVLELVTPAAREPALAPVRVPEA